MLNITLANYVFDGNTFCLKSKVEPLLIKQNIKTRLYKIAYNIPHPFFYPDQHSIYT